MAVHFGRESINITRHEVVATKATEACVATETKCVAFSLKGNPHTEHRTKTAELRKHALASEKHTHTPQRNGKTLAHRPQTPRTHNNHAPSKEMATPSRTDPRPKNPQKPHDNQ